MYAGTMPQNYAAEKDATTLMKIAHKYQIKPLTEYNEKRLIERFGC
jgi:hypothetical protein